MALDPAKNFAKVKVSTGYDASAVSIALTAGNGAKLPAPGTDGAFNLVWWNESDYPNPSDDPNVEIVRCTARSTDALTITRAQEGTSASTKNTSGKSYSMALGFTAKVRTDLETRLAATESVANGAATLAAGAVPESLFDAKGDILAATADNTPAKLGIGTDGQVLMADSSQAKGLKWADAPSPGGVYTAMLGDGSDGSLHLDGTADTTKLGHRGVALSIPGPSNNNTITITLPGGSVVLTAVSTIGSSPGNVKIGDTRDTTDFVNNLLGMLLNPGTTSSTQVALSAGDQAIIKQAIYRHTGNTAIKAVSITPSTSAFTITSTISGWSATADTNAYALGRDIHCSALTIDSGITLWPNGFKIFCTGTLNNAGTIENDGSPGLTGGVWGTSYGAGKGGFGNSLGAGADGGVGAQSGGSGGGSASHSLGGNGGNGGASQFSGGPGGTITAAIALPFLSALLLTMLDITIAAIALYTGGAGGGGGGGQNSSNNASGGGAGGGGGLIAIFAKIITNSGTIRAAGGVGGAQSAQGGAYGGGGGGGAVLTCTTSLTNTGTISAPGGTSSSNNGSDGNVYAFTLP